jgi:hypothetical protein
VAKKSKFVVSFDSVHRSRRGGVDRGRGEWKGREGKREREEGEKAIGLGYGKRGKGRG